MKKIYTYLLVVITIGFSACEKDNVVLTTDRPGTPVIVVPLVTPISIPPAEDSTLLLGNPSDAKTDEAYFSNYLLSEGYYSVSYNRDRGTSNWVSWHLANTDIGSISRQSDFRSNNNLPFDWYHVDNSSYTGSGFDRGHMCPSADRTATDTANSSTFLMTNIIPQAPYCNQVTWAGLETYSRTLVQSGKELYIISGSYGEGGTLGTSGTTTTINNGKVTVPAQLFKIIVVLPNGGDDLSRVTNTVRTIAVLMPNSDADNADWKTYRTSIDNIENETGYDFLNKVSTSIQDVLEARVDNL